MSANSNATSIAGNKVTGVTGSGTSVVLATAPTITLPNINNFKGGYTTQATAAGTTTLTVNSTYFQYFTGTLAQDVVLPDATTLTAGFGFYIDNNSTTAIVVKTNGGATLFTIAANSDLLVKVTDVSTAAGVWDLNPYAYTNVANTWSETQTMATGTASKAAMNIPAGVLKTTPSDGDIESDGDAMYGTTDGGNRGVIPLEHIIRADATRTFTSNTSQQAIFNNPANGTLTLETGTYLFEALISMDTMSATSGNGKFSLNSGGTATLAAILYQAYAQDSALDTVGTISGLAEVAATQVAANIATAAAAVVKVGSYFKCNRVGSTSMTSVGQWS